MGLLFVIIDSMGWLICFYVASRPLSLAQTNKQQLALLPRVFYISRLVCPFLLLLSQSRASSGPTLNSIHQTDVDTLMIRTQSRVRVRVIYLNQTVILRGLR